MGERPEWVDTGKRLRIGHTTKMQKTFSSVKCFSGFNVETLLGDYRHRNEPILLGGLGVWSGHFFAAWKFLGSHLY